MTQPYCLAKSPKELSIGGIEPYLCTEPAFHRGRHKASHVGTGQVFAEWGDPLVGTVRATGLASAMFDGHNWIHCGDGQGSFRIEFDRIKDWAIIHEPTEI